MEMSPAARHWGALWGSRPADWAVTEEQQTRVYEAALSRVALVPGQHVLDVGCGTGVFLRMCADRGARTSGIDAAEGLLGLAAARVPEADLRLGDMLALPYEDATFDLVTGFTSFFFAADMVAALREAVRVARPGAPVVMQVFGRPERCDLEAVKTVVKSFRGGGHGTYWRPGIAEQMAREAGLTITHAFDTAFQYRYADEDAALDAMLAAGGAAVVAGPEREPDLRAGIRRALAPCRRSDGSYRISNEWRVVIGITPRRKRLGD
jgi:ubiquinone/menaquinone biosynthesis C-methylase UbiE